MKATKAMTVGGRDCYAIPASHEGERVTVLVPQGTPVRYVRTPLGGSSGSG